MHRFRYVLVDVFTSRPLEGNQLAVFTDATRMTEPLLQRIAREMNLSETVFVYPPSDRKQAHVSLRIFTPTTELPFAGHPVLGAAFVLGLPLQAVELVLETGAGRIPVVLERDGAKIVFGWMRQPVPTVAPVPADAQAALLAALGLSGSTLPVEAYDNGVGHLYIGLGSPGEVAALQPDLGRLAAALPAGITGVNCFAGAGTVWKTRMFAPAAGVAEDPATGSAAGPLALHLSRNGVVPFGQEIEISQGAEVGRPSTLYARAEGSADEVLAIQVGGSAVTVGRGELQL